MAEHDDMSADQPDAPRACPGAFSYHPRHRQGSSPDDHRSSRSTPPPIPTCFTPAISPIATSVPGARTWTRCWRLLGYESLDNFIDAVVPEEIRLRRPLALPPGRSEREVLQALRGLAGMNRVFRSYIGMGYAGCFTPQVIQRNVLENPGWYTAYTPYQAEISQGRLEALLNFQTMVSDLTGLRGRQRVAARRGDRRRRSDEPDAGGRAPRRPTRSFWWTSIVTRRRSPWCGPGPRRAGIRVVVGEPETFDVRAGRDRRAGAVSGDRRRGPRLPQAVASGRTPPARWSRRRPICSPSRCSAAGRVGRRHRGRQQPAIRRADGLRRAARRVLRDPRRVQAVPAGPDHRRLEGPRRPTRRSAWRCRPASSTSAATRRRATSARRRCCSR